MPTSPCFGLWVLYTGVVLAQSVELSGLIKGTNGGSIAGASVELRNRENGARRLTDANRKGFYSFSALNPGTYQATFQADGFRTLTREAIVLNVAERANLDATLELIAVRESVNVTAEIPRIDSISPAVGTVVDEQFVGNLPLNGHSFQSLLDLTPGLVIMRSYQDAPGQFSVNGQRTNSSYFVVDGVSAAD